MSNEQFIVSASRRTDIPAFYSEWLIQRFREGRAEYVHPFHNRRIEVGLDPALVAAVVFWTKDFAPMLDRLAELDRLGFSRWLVHYTITGLGPAWEPRAPKTEKAVETFLRLIDIAGPTRVLWRFDPIVITEKVTVDSTLDRFTNLCDGLGGSAAACVTSMMAPYAKIAGRIGSYEREHGDKLIEPVEDDLAALAMGLAEIGASHGVTVHSCCTSGLAGFGVHPARCIDGGLIKSLWPGLDLAPAPSPTRKGCGCDRAVDIGAYDTCPHRCLYCYANAGDSTIEKRRRAHRPEAPSLLG